MLRLKEEKSSSRQNGPKTNLYDVGNGKQWWEKFEKSYGPADAETKTFVFYLPRELGSVINKRKENPEDIQKALNAILENDRSYEFDMFEESLFKYFRNLVLTANERKVYHEGENSLHGFVANLPRNDIDTIHVAEFTKRKIEKALQAINAIVETERVGLAATRPATVKFNEEVEVVPSPPPSLPPPPSPTSPTVAPIVTSSKGVTR